MDAVGSVYGGHPDLLSRIQAEIRNHAHLENLFLDIAHHFQNQESDAPASKRRKRNDGSVEPTNGVSSQTNVKKTMLLEIKDVSFSMPQRKKMHLTIAQCGDRLPSPNSFVIWLTDPKTGNIDTEASISDFAHVLCLPVPEKPQKSSNYCFVPSASRGDAIVFTLPAGPLKNYLRAKEWDAAFPTPSDETPLDDILSNMLPLHSLSLVKPDAAQFTSAFPEVQRKKEKAYHVKAHIGTKDGYLFFLSTGIFFGFKKPLKFLPLEAIESTAFTRAMSRTFALAITYREEGNEEGQEVEFDQIDTQEYAAIGEYVQRHHLKDGSFAEARKAKIVKKEKGEQQNGENGVDEDGRTELEKAEQEIQDEEDEEEEDYEPDEDSGSESGSEDEEYTEGKVKNLVGDELGSEAEDVSDDGEDAEDADMDDAGEEEEEEEEEEKEEEDDEEPADDYKVMPQRTAAPAAAMFSPSNRTGGEPDPEDDEQL